MDVYRRQIPFLFVFLSHLLVAACNSPSRDIPVSRTLSKGAAKKVSTDRSQKSKALLDMGEECLNLERIIKTLKSNNEEYTVYVRDIDVGTLTFGTGKKNGGMRFDSSKTDPVIRAQQILLTATDKPQIAQSPPQPLSETVIAPFLYLSQERCDSVNVLSASNDVKPIRFKVVSHDGTSATLQEENKPDGIILVFSVEDNGLSIERYRPQVSPLSCSLATPVPNYEKTVFAMEWGKVSEVTLQYGFAQQLDKYLKVKIPELSAARPSSPGVVSIGYSGVGYPFELVKNGQFEKPTCPSPSK